MFDPYSQMSAHTRKVAFLHPPKLTTWQDAVRDNRDTDLNPSSQDRPFESLLDSFTAHMKTRFNQWRLHWSHGPLGPIINQKQDVAIESHSHARR